MYICDLYTFSRCFTIAIQHFHTSPKYDLPISNSTEDSLSGATEFSMNPNLPDRSFDGTTMYTMVDRITDWLYDHSEGSPEASHHASEGAFQLGQTAASVFFDNSAPAGLTLSQSAQERFNPESLAGLYNSIFMDLSVNDPNLSHDDVSNTVMNALMAHPEVQEVIQLHRQDLMSQESDSRGAEESSRRATIIVGTELVNRIRSGAAEGTPGKSLSINPDWAPSGVDNGQAGGSTNDSLSPENLTVIYKDLNHEMTPQYKTEPQLKVAVWNRIMKREDVMERCKRMHSLILTEHKDLVVKNGWTSEQTKVEAVKQIRQHLMNTVDTMLMKEG
jgi:hypothetical protein